MRRSVKEKDSSLPSENGNSSHVKILKPPVVRKGKLVVVDLAGSERIDKSGACLNYFIDGIIYFIYLLVPILKHSLGGQLELKSFHIVFLYVSTFFSSYAQHVWLIEGYF